MEGREKRRDQTVRYGERARRIHLKKVHQDGPVDCVCEFSAWFFAKGKAVGCRCRRVQRGLSPKIAGSLCHGGGSGSYHPCVIERIRGKRLTKAWLLELRALPADDVNL